MIDGKRRRHSPNRVKREWYAKHRSMRRVAKLDDDEDEHDPQTTKLITEMSRSIDREDFPLAQQQIDDLAKKIGPDHPDLVRSRWLIEFLEG